MNRHSDMLALGDAAADTMALAPIGFSDGAQTPPEVPPSEFLLVRYGDNDFTKGEEMGRFAFDEESADHVIADFAKRGKDVVVDYEHQTLSGNEAPAAGWIRALAKTAAGRAPHRRAFRSGRRPNPRITRVRGSPDIHRGRGHADRAKTTGCSLATVKMNSTPTPMEFQLFSLGVSRMMRRSLLSVLNSCNLKKTVKVTLL